MTDKVKTKIVDLREKKPEKKSSLVLKAKKQGKPVTAEKIKELNEEKLKSLKSKEEKVENLKPVEQKIEEKKVEKKYELSIDLKDLLAAGSHLGHKAAKTSPKAREYIYASRDGIEVLDLIKTKQCLEDACNYLYQAAKGGKKIAMVGTKRQAREVVKRVALDCGIPYVTERWLGGTITNWEQIRRNVRRLAEIKDGLANNKYVDKTKKEVLLLGKEAGNLEKMVGGLAGLDKLFEVLVVVDIGFEKTAVREANLRGIKIVGMADTDSNPRLVDYPVPANDDSVKSVILIVEEFGKAIKEGGKNGGAKKDN